MIQKFLNIIKEQFQLNEIEIGEYQKLKAKGMTFSIRQFYASGLGNVSVMSASGFFGLMKMDTFIVNPTEIDLPLFSYGRIYAMGNDTLILELYNTLLGEYNLNNINNIKNNYAHLPEHDLGKHWYDSIKFKESISKKGKKIHTQQFDKLTEEYFKAYISGTSQISKCDSFEKKEKASIYVNGLLTNGGPSTDIFKKQFGNEKTAYLFKKILFGTI